jgi:hypothetical protein
VAKRLTIFKSCSEANAPFANGRVELGIHRRVGLDCQLEGLAVI